MARSSDGVTLHTMSLISADESRAIFIVFAGWIHGRNPNHLGGEIHHFFSGAIDFEHGGLNFSATAFLNRLHDAIANVTLGRGPGSFPGVGFVAGDYRQRRNIEAIKVHGLEATGRFHTGPWTFALGASLTKARIDANAPAADLDGLRPAQTPQVIASASAAWERDGRAISLELRHVGSQFEDDLNNDKLRSATTVNAFAAWPLSTKVQLIARGQNLLDEVIEATINDDGSIERGSPRIFWVGLRLST